jgi:uncharacterized protein CbrC (UPF0167 family)
MMNISTFIAKVDIFELLGLNLSDEEKGNFLEKVARVLTGRIMQYAIEDNAITEKDLQDIQALGDKYIAVQETIMDKIKGIEKYMLDASFDFKLEAFLKQVNDFMAFVGAKDKNEVGDDEYAKLVEVVNQIKDIVDKDVDVDFIEIKELMAEEDEIVKKFRGLVELYEGYKGKYGFK